MIDIALGDQREVERLDPDQRLTERRKNRDEEEYRVWCESSYGIVELGQEQFHPADVLERLAPDAARRGRDECSVIVRTGLEETVCEQFPAPIAIPFHSFLEGPRSPLERLHRLRDTWESLIRLLAALTLCEAAAAETPVTRLVLREGSDQGWRDCKQRDLLSDKLSVRIGLIEGVLRRARDLGVTLQTASLLPMEVLGEVRRLNVVRNSFSHAPAKSEIQANELIDDAYPVLREVLLDLRDMQNIDLMRIRNIQVGGTAEIEQLNGHAQSRRINELTLEGDAAALIMSATTIEDLHRVFARVGRQTLDLSPFFYAADDETGHRTNVWGFRFKKDDHWHMECVADSTTKRSPVKPHEDGLLRFGNLLAPIGEGS